MVAQREKSKLEAFIESKRRRRLRTQSMFNLLEETEPKEATVTSGNSQVLLNPFGLVFPTERQVRNNLLTLINDLQPPPRMNT
jgi:hypothetical protein